MKKEKTEKHNTKTGNINILNYKRDVKVKPETLACAVSDKKPNCKCSKRIQVYRLKSWSAPPPLFLIPRATSFLPL